MRKIITLLFLLLSICSYGQKKGRAVSDAIHVQTKDWNPIISDSIQANKIDWNPIISDSTAVNKIDTLYFANDTLYLDAWGRLWKTVIAASGSGDGYVSSLAWNSGTGVITANDPVNVAKTIDIDGRYGQLGGGNTWTNTNLFTRSVTINESTSQLYFKDGSTFNGQILGTSTGLVVDANVAQLTLRGDTKSIYISSTGIKADLDAATSPNAVYLQADGELTYGAAGGSSAFSGAKVSRSTNLTISSSGTTVTFNSENFDTDSYHSTSTNTERLTVSSTGYYRIAFHATVQISTTLGGLDLLIYENTTNTDYIGEYNGGSSNTQASVSYSNIHYLTSGSYVKAELISRNANSTLLTDKYVSFSIEKL